MTPKDRQDLMRSLRVHFPNVVSCQEKRTEVHLELSVPWRLISGEGEQVKPRRVWVIISADRRINVNVSGWATGPCGYMEWPGMKGPGWIARCVHQIDFEVRRNLDLEQGFQRRPFQTIKSLYSVAQTAHAQGKTVRIEIDPLNTTVSLEPHGAAVVRRTLFECVKALEDGISRGYDQSSEGS
jgi:hypothetical protein